MPRGKPVFMTYMRTKERGNKSSQRADPPLLDAKEKKDKDKDADAETKRKLQK